MRQTYPQLRKRTILLSASVILLTASSVLAFQETAKPNPITTTDQQTENIDRFEQLRHMFHGLLERHSRGQ